MWSGGFADSLIEETFNTNYTNHINVGQLYEALRLLHQKSDHNQHKILTIENRLEKIEMILAHILEILEQKKN